MTERKVRIGITVLIDKPSDSLFTNGIRQNVIILRDLFAKCKNVQEAYIINTAKNVVIPDDDSTTWGPYAKNIITLEEAKDKCDLIVMAQGSAHIDVYRELSKKGIKITKHIMGAELNVFNETVLFKDNKEARNLYTRNAGTVSNVWISPHFFETDRYFFETQYDCESVVGPYVWDPRFIQHHIDIFKSKDPNETGLYKPSGKLEKRLSTMEPNINMVKTSAVPIMITERLERKHPETLEKLSVFCGDGIKKKTDMINFVKELDSYKNKKMFFESRYPIVWTLLKHTDIVLCHQHQCALNYLYLDAAWMGYPVVHNSEYMKELGWYYEGNDAEKAVEHLKHVAYHFDEENHQNEEYIKKSRAFAYRYMIDNPENIRGYEKLIDKAMNK
jgi:hypothetical protein